ncbi:uncharacterized protein [Aegilops tauschii subsp. strangulata]|uniref:uncharacterized protein isoform X2 n=1 Tax=Aegilops tauschii subsp. strangulata TaxID=200361 RepID=UPI001ABC471C
MTEATEPTPPEPPPAPPTAVIEEPAEELHERAPASAVAEPPPVRSPVPAVAGSGQPSASSEVKQGEADRSGSDPRPPHGDRGLSQRDPGGSPSPHSDRDAGVLNPTRWRIRFAVVRNGEAWFDGFLHAHSSSCCRVMMDHDKYILAGRYLDGGEHISEGYLPSHCADPYVVATHSDGGQGAFGYWIYPMGDGSTGYFQLVWMAVM